MEVFAKAPNQRSTVVHTSSGDSTTTFDGHIGWVAAADKLTQVVAMTGGNLTGAKLDAALSFPAQMKQIFSQWRSDLPATSIDERDVRVLEGVNNGETPVKLYFDANSGLLVRQVRYSETGVGLNPTHANRLFGLS